MANSIRHIYPQQEMLWGKLYCAKHFDASSKVRANAIIKQINQSLEDQLEEVDWVESDGTRKNALKKLLERFDHI